MHAQPRVPKVPVFTAHRQTKLYGQHTAVAPPDIKCHGNTRGRMGGRTRMCLKLKPDLED